MNIPLLLKQLGLSSKEIEIYQLMLTLDTSRASNIVKKSEIPRGTVYEILNTLKEKGLIEESRDKGNVSVFRARHPFALKEFIENKKTALKQTEAELESAFPTLISWFSQAQTKPGVTFYEGKEGAWKVLQDTLTSKTEILSIVDNSAANTIGTELNKKYVTQRKKKKLKKKLLLLNIDRDKLPTQDLYTQYKILKNSSIPVNTSIQIYDNKIAYITMTGEYFASTLIEDPNIYNMHKLLFEFMWQQP